jgi:hypothetical protein
LIKSLCDKFLCSSSPSKTYFWKLYKSDL